MFDESFMTAFTVEESPDTVFAAINDVRGWWGEGVDGSNARVGDEFEFRVEGVHCSRIEVVEHVPAERIVWRVLANHMSYVEDQTEWVGTTIRFELRAKDDGTEIRFAHEGLVPAAECFDVCSSVWGSLMHGSLRSLIATGKGRPYPKALAERRELPRVA